MKTYEIKRRKITKPKYKIDYSSELNEEQLEVVMHPDGKMLVIAGAGSGKTRALTYRVARLIEDEVHPSKILLLTFTNKAAREMLSRVQALTGLDIMQIWGGTFHHIGNLILRRHSKLLNLEKSFTIMDEEDSKELMESVISNLGLYDKPFRFPKADVLYDIYQLIIDKGEDIEILLNKRFPQIANFQGEILKVFYEYNNKKAKENLVDFEDLLLLWKKLLEEKEDIRRYYQERFLHILVDEYQDTNKLQAEILYLMVPNEGNIMVVGDDAQSIYSFRGANFKNIMEFPEKFKNVKVFYLKTNYRSLPEILKLANYSISHNTYQYPKELKPIRKEGKATVAICPTRDVYEQADFVANRVLDLIDEGYPLKEIAILYRSHYQSLEVQIKLTEMGIPYEIRSGVRFFEQRHIKDVLSFLKITVNPSDEIAWRRALKIYPSIGDKLSTKIFQELSNSKNIFGYAVTQKILEIIPNKAKSSYLDFQKLLKKLLSENFKKSPSESIRIIVEDVYKDYAIATFPNASSRLDDLEELALYSTKYPNVEEFLSELSLLSELSGRDVMPGIDERDAIVLSTVHQAKGLEWKVVFIIGLADGNFPAHWSFSSKEDLEEERRLFYVACTRAKDELYLVYPQWTKEGYKGTSIQRISRFLQEIDPDLYEVWNIR